MINERKSRWKIYLCRWPSLYKFTFISK